MLSLKALLLWLVFTRILPMLSVLMVLQPIAVTVLVWVTAGTDLFSTGVLALHWGPFCGNDTIEGVAMVDEPTPLVLFGLAACGLVVARRKNTANKPLI